MRACSGRGLRNGSEQTTTHRHNPLLKLGVLVPNGALLEKLEVRAVIGVAAEGDVNDVQVRLARGCQD